jgi:hypothetical protein
MRHNLKIPDLPFLAMQSGGGGGGVTPLSFANLEAWWKADSFSLPDGTGVGGVGNEWVDQVGDTNHDGRQTTSSIQPIFHTNISGSMPAILFTWKNDFTDQHYLDASNGSEGNSIIPASDFTVLGVVQPNALSTATGGSFLGQAYAGNNCALAIQTNALTSLADNDQIHGNASASFSDQLGLTGMYGYVRSGGNLTYYLNMANVTNGAPTAVNQGRFNFIGAVSAPNLLARWGGYIMEILVYSQALTAVNVNSLYTKYFKPRWVDLP